MIYATPGQAGVSLDVLQELGGWESQEMVMRYAHLSTDHLRDYVMKIEGTKSPTGGMKERIG